jgi:quinol monooxygenase YgiN
VSGILRDRRALTAVLLFSSATIAEPQTPAQAPPLVATARVAYFEVAPSEAARAIGVLKTYRQTTQKAPGAKSTEVLQQIGRPNFFAIHETWSDGTSLQGHLTSAGNRKLRDDLQSALISPFDERLLAPVTVQPATAVISNDAIYVLTHADSVDRGGTVTMMLQALADGARRERGNVLFDVTVQPNRTNHFTLVEVWVDQKTFEAHTLAENTRRFRTTFGPISGALYDERIYKVVN